MITLSKLRLQAINAAKNANWDEAIHTNLQILEETPQDINALNRLGLAHLQLGESKKAKESFEQTLQVDKTNSIAKRQLERITSKLAAPAPAFHREYFIEEPGITKIVELHRLAGKQIVDTLSVGQLCNLVLKKRYISVETSDGVYIGALPEDISFRLSKLISSGNTYSCRVHTVTAKLCTVYLKELTRSKRNEDLHSFPPNKTAAGHGTELDDRFLLDDDEMSLDGVESEEEEEEEDRGKPFHRRNIESSMDVD